MSGASPTPLLTVNGVSRRHQPSCRMPWDRRMTCPRQMGGGAAVWNGFGAAVWNFFGVALGNGEGARSQCVGGVLSRRRGVLVGAGVLLLREGRWRARRGRCYRFQGAIRTFCGCRGAAVGVVQSSLAMET